MSVFYIVCCVVLGLMVLSGIFYVSYLVESMKSKKALLLAKAGDKVQKYQRFLDVFPPNTLPKDIQLVLIEEIIHNLNTIKKLGTDSKADRLYETAVAQQKTIQKAQDKPPQVPQVKDMQAAQEIQVHFKNLFKLLKFIATTRKHHTKVINKNLKVLQSLFVETSASVHKRTAEQAIQQSKSKLALYHLNLAIGEYARVDSKKFANEIKALRNRSQELDKAMKAQKNTTSSASEQVEKPGKKDRGLDRMFDESASNSAKRKM